MGNRKEAPVVVIIGRPNVGKSFLFNRFAGRAISLVDDTPGVTRDRLYAEVRWRGKTFNLVDTGGFYPGMKGISSMIERQIEFSIKEASVIVWVLDAKDGVTAIDEDISEKLRLAQSTKPVILAINKSDNISRMEDTGDFCRLGFGEPVPVSALHGLNTDALLDKIISFLPRAIATLTETISIAIVGRPNVGKSSFINALLKDERVIVDALPGTTRGVIPVPFSSGDERFTLLDTSGLKKRKRISTELEKKMSVWTMRAIRHSHVCVLLVDALEGMTSQDVRIADYIWQKGKGIVIAFNKWDLVRGDDKLRRQYKEALERRFPVSSFCPVVFMSAIQGENIFKAISLARTVFGHSRIRIKTHMLNEVIGGAVKKRETQYVRGRHLKILYLTQVDVSPPSFVFFVNDTALVKESYKRYLVKELYANFDFSGVPLRIFFRERR